MNGSATVRQVGPNRMVVKGCALAGLLCKEQRWTRVGLSAAVDAGNLSRQHRRLKRGHFARGVAVGGQVRGTARVPSRARLELRRVFSGA